MYCRYLCNDSSFRYVIEKFCSNLEKNVASISARASRSYCIGLRHADIEMDIAIGFVSKAVERVRINAKKIWSGPYNTADEKFMKIGEYAIKQKEYFPSHPLKRNY